MKNKLYYIRLFLCFCFFILSVLAILGIFYPIKFFNIQFFPLLQRLLIDSSLVTISLCFIILLITLFYGRMYCSILCPLGFLQEVFCLFFKKKKVKSSNEFYKYILSAVIVGILFSGSATFIRYFEPYTIFSSAFSLSLTGIISIILILLLNLISSRFFCKKICPVGVILGLLSRYSLNKLNIDERRCISCQICMQNCDMGCIDISEHKIDNENCVMCLKCFSSCPEYAIGYGIKTTDKKFSLRRRNALFSFAIVTIFVSAVKFGKYALQTVQNLKQVILPPGVFNKSDFINKCFNCNLCVENCPSKILSKANEYFGTVHIDYEQGDRFCKYDCINCSQVCPTGAIKRISKEEKKKIRIAIAQIDIEKCMNCGLCRMDCPTSAIYQNEDGKSVVDISKCIGCAKCKVNCNYHAVNIFAEDKQIII